jgi:glycosyltransferase involved in cell wall biosynthesis/ribosomal protein S18 acetylase RimI-like enzyme
MNQMLETIPFVSVIIPVRNESRFIEKSLKTFIDNNYPPNMFEIIVVDGASEDGTADIVKAIAIKDPRVILLSNSERITPISMNLGIKAACGEIILIVGAHSEFSNDYLTSCVEALERTGADCVGGYMETIPGSLGIIAKAICRATTSPFGVGDAKFRTGGLEEKEVDTVAFGAFRRKVFEKVGFYNPLLVRNQDMEFSTRMRKAGYKIVISPKINFKYYNRGTFRGLWQQAFNNGLWNPYTIWLVGSGLSLRHFIPMFFVLSISLFAVADIIWPPIQWLLEIYILLYLGTALFFAARSAKLKMSDTILTLWAFVVLHVSYGLGSLWAIITIPFKFPCRRGNRVGKPLADIKQEPSTLKESSEQNSETYMVRFKHLERDLFPEIAELHIKNIPTGFISSLGKDFVTTVYRAIEKDQQSFGFVAMQNDKLLGFISFSNDLRGLYKVAVLEMGPKFGRALFKKLFSFKVIKKIIGDVLYPFKANKLKLPNAELLSIIVVPDARGKGIAGRLVEAGLNLCKMRGIDSVKVLVAAENEPANKLYQKYGFEFRTKIDSHGVLSNVYVKDLAREKQL